MRAPNFSCILFIAVAVVLLPSAPALALFVPMPDVPVDRLIKNVEARVKENPDDADAVYTLGRIHYLAFALKTDTLKAREQPGKLPAVPDMFNRKRPPEPGQPAKPAIDDKAVRAHLVSAFENLNRAIALDPKTALYHLGRGSAAEQALSADIDLPPLPGSDAKDDLKSVYREAAIASYLQAFDLANAEDLKIKSKPITGLSSLVSYEAGRGYKRLVEARGATDQEKESLAKVSKGIAALEAKPMGPITPIVFGFSPAATIDDLLAADARVSFDLDGTGRDQQWPWVKPTTSILVWDPRHTGRIESGRQLFGSVTWWIFWTDGYTAMDALDDNRDGELAGDELTGLAVWTDANSNGVSDAGEVLPIESTPIAAIVTHAAGRDGVHPHHPLGLRLRDGRRLATWDWVASPAD